MRYFRRCVFAPGEKRILRDMVRDYSFERDFLVNTVKFDTALVEDVAAQDDLVVEKFAAVAVNFHCSDGCVADRQIEVGGNALIGFTADALNDGGGTANLQLQGGDDRKWDEGAIGAGIEKGVNCGAG